MNGTQQPNPLEQKDAQNADDRSAPKEKTIGVSEVFGPTIQGEGPLFGSRTSFIRFAGCDYRCTKCDSLHAVIPNLIQQAAERLTTQEILDRVIPVNHENGTAWVTLSGGNPCMWDLNDLIDGLRNANLGIAVETQGTLTPAWLSKCHCVVISPKSPGMGERFEQDKFLHMINYLSNHGVMTAVKIVVFSQQDMEFAVTVQKLLEAQVEAPPPGLMGNLYLSQGNPYPPVPQQDGQMVYPAQEELSQTLLKEYAILLEDFGQDKRLIHWRFLPQLHVLVWGDEAKH